MAKLVRKGECNNCGWCCQFVALMRIVKDLSLPFGRIDEDLKRYHEFRNGVMGADGILLWVAQVLAPCVMHDNETKRCMIYEDRPQICREAPLTPNFVEGTPCSYWFEILDEDGNVVEYRGGLGSPHPTPPQFKEYK